MQKPLGEHIRNIQTQILVLQKGLREANLPDYLRSKREIELNNAEEALRLFRRAYEFEQKMKLKSDR